jgi:hypothetical protein
VTEEIDPLAGPHLDNFPRAYSHVGFVNCALNLARQTGPVEERAKAEARPPVAASAAPVTAGYRNDSNEKLDQLNSNL